MRYFTDPRNVFIWCTPSDYGLAGKNTHLIRVIKSINGRLGKTWRILQSTISITANSKIYECAWNLISLMIWVDESHFLLFFFALVFAPFDGISLPLIIDLGQTYYFLEKRGRNFMNVKANWCWICRIFTIYCPSNGGGFVLGAILSTEKSVK